MDARAERGQVIADTRKIRRKGHMHLVPSQSGNGTYYVDPNRNYCSCPDHAETGFICKHIYAVRFTLTRTDTNADGSTTASTLTVEAKMQRTTYKQD